MSYEFIPTGNPYLCYWPGRQGRKVIGITLHSMAGYMEPSIRQFQNSLIGTSANYLIAGEREVQMVRDEDAAYHCGYFAGNLCLIGIEHEGGSIRQSDGSYLDVPMADATYSTSIARCVALCRKFGLDPFGKITLPDGRVLDTIHMHREIVATACPTLLDVGRIRDGVRAYMAAAAPQQVEILGGRATTVHISGTAGTGLNIRSKPTSKAPSVGSVADNASVAVLGSVPGESVGGNASWWKIADGRYVSAFYAAEVASQPAPPVAHYSFPGDLTPGMSGSQQVAELQRALKALGYFSVEATGNYGSITAGAVLAFQKDADDPDRHDGSKIMPRSASYPGTLGAGWFGPRTRSALNAKQVTKP